VSKEIIKYRGCHIELYEENGRWYYHVPFETTSFGGVKPTKEEAISSAQEMIRLFQEEREKDMPTNVDKFFVSNHLPQHLQEVAKPIEELAKLMDESLPDGAEKSAGMRKLLEAKDCFIRAGLNYESS